MWVMTDGFGRVAVLLAALGLVSLVPVAVAQQPMPPMPQMPAESMPTVIPAVPDVSDAPTDRLEGAAEQTAAQTRAQQYVDHPLLARFPDSEIVDYEFAEDENHRVVLGSLQRTRGVVVPEDSELLRGNVTRITYEASQDFTGEDVYRFFLQQMREKNYREMFTCVGRACGSGNYWANDIFRNRALYGPERNQYYLSMQAGLGLQTEPRISIYVITRGNRRIYAYVEIVEVGGAVGTSASVEALLVSLRTDGAVVLPALNYDDYDRLAANADFTVPLGILQADDSLQVYLVGHLQGEGGVEELTRRSRVRAEWLREALISAGVDAARITAAGVGPLAPVCNGGDCAERMEMVLR